MRHSAFAQTTTRYQDLDKLIDYRKYSGTRNTWFEENFLTPRLRELPASMRDVG